jgi:hypothetical protein
MAVQDTMTMSPARSQMNRPVRRSWALLPLTAALALTTIVTAGGAQSVPPRAPAASLARPIAGPKPADANGFLQRWLLLEPQPINGQLTQTAVQAAVATEEFRTQLAALPREGDTVKAGNTQLTWHAVDTLAYNVNLYHFAYALNKPTSNVLFSVATVVHAPREMNDVRLAIGSNAASVWWVNGREVIGIYNDRQTVIDDGVSKRLTLKQGANVIRAAILNAGGATDFCARFLDAQHRPITGITLSLFER